MKRTMCLLVGAILACGLSATKIDARGGGGGGHGGGGGGHGGFAGGHGGYGGGYGHGGYGGYGRGFGYGGYGYGGYGGFYGGGYGLGYGGYGLGYGGGLGYPYYGYGYGYPSYGYGGYGYPYPATTVPPTYNNYYYTPPVVPQAAPPMVPPTATPPLQYISSPTTAPVQLEVMVPQSDAQVWVEGKLTTTKGLDRIFVTNPLDKGYTYAYAVKASWRDTNGNVVTRERNINVTPGTAKKVDFTRTTIAVSTK